MGGRVTMRDVARAAGVSPMTVSRALKDDGSVNAQTRTQVRAAADRLGYVYDTTAQAFRAQRSGFLAVTLPSINNANFAATHRALTDTLDEAGLQVLLGITHYAVEAEERLVRQLMARRPEAVVLTGGHHTDGTRRLLAAANVPVVELWDVPTDPLGHVVGFSNAEAMGLLVDHLARSGRQRLGFLGPSGDSDRRGAARRTGVIAAAARLGLPAVTLLEAGPAPVTMTDGMQAVDALGDAWRGLDALICVSDPVAFGAIMGLRRVGVHVPGDIAVTGFGAFEIAHVAEPTLTTVDVSAARIGREAGELVAKILGEQAVPRSIVIDPVLRLGGSA